MCTNSPDNEYGESQYGSYDQGSEKKTMMIDEYSSNSTPSYTDSGDVGDYSYK